MLSVERGDDRRAETFRASAGDIAAIRNHGTFA
jgi:hypothetical protein